MQTGHQNNGGRRGGQIQVGVCTAHQAREFFVNDADQRLARRQAGEHFLTQCACFDRLDEVLDDWQRNVGFKQRQPDLAQGVLHVGFGDACLPAERFDDTGEASTEIF